MLGTKGKLAKQMMRKPFKKYWTPCKTGIIIDFSERTLQELETLFDCQQEYRPSDGIYTFGYGKRNAKRYHTQINFLYDQFLHNRVIGQVRNRTDLFPIFLRVNDGFDLLIAARLAAPPRKDLALDDFNPAIGILPSRFIDSQNYEHVIKLLTNGSIQRWNSWLKDAHIGTFLTLESIWEHWQKTGKSY